jgi:hypothetical protein
VPEVDLGVASTDVAPEVDSGVASADAALEVDSGAGRVDLDSLESEALALSLET